MRSGSLRLRAWPTMALAAALVLSLVPGVAAQPSSDEVRQDLEQARERLDGIDEQLSRAVEEYNTAQIALEDSTAQVEATRRQLARLKDERTALDALVGDHVRRLHKLGPALELTAIVAAGDPTEAGMKAWTIRRILDDQRTDLEALDANRTTVAAVEARAVDERRQAQERAERHEAARAEVEELFATTEEEVEELTVLLEDTVEEERRRAEEERLRREAEAAAAREAEREAQREAEAAAAREAEREAEREAARTTSTSGDGDASSSSSPSSTSSAPSGPSGPSGASAPAPAPPSTPEPKPEPKPEPAPEPAPSTRSSADVAVRTALAQLGKPYAWGGSGPGSFDCSGLTSFAWRAAGVGIPRTSGSQFAGTKRISRSELRPGDLVFYHSPISHVAMYIGDGKVVEAPNSGNNVRIRNDGLTRRGVVGFGRV